MNVARPASRRMRSLRILIGGLGLAALVGVTSLLIEGWHLGWTLPGSLERTEADVRNRTAAMIRTLRSASEAIAARRDLISRADVEEEAVRELFDAVDSLVRSSASDLSITVYGADGVPLAWGGRPSELPPDRIAGSRSLFVAPGPLGLRLIHLEPVGAPAAGAATPEAGRIGTVAAERVLSPATAVDRQLDAGLKLDTATVPVALTTRFQGAGERLGPTDFLVVTPEGEPLFEAHLAAADLAQARARWRRTTVGLMLGVLGLTCLLLAVPLLDGRRHATTLARQARLSLGIAALLIGARTLVWLGTPTAWAGPSLLSPATYASATFGPWLGTPLDFLLTSLVALALAVLGVDLAYRGRISRHGRRIAIHSGRAGFVLTQIGAGIAAAGAVAGYEVLLADTVDNTTLDLLKLSLHPWNPARFAMQAGLVFGHAALVTGLVGLFVAAVAPWRPGGRSPWHTWGPLGLWLAPAAVLSARYVSADLPTLAAGSLLVAASAGVAARLAPRTVAWVRHASQAPRLIAFFFALLIPSLVLYPSFFARAQQAKREIVETQYAPQLIRHPDELQAKLAESLTQIDALPGLDTLVASLEPPAGSVQTESAFLVWSQTDLAEFRLTSALELYDVNGTLLSRFALNFPESPALLPDAFPGPCAWTLVGEAAPIGSDERRMLHAERALCTGGTPVGAVMVHVLLDYSALPFISSRSPYFEFFQPQGGAVPEDLPAHDVQLVIYGWGRLPQYVSGNAVWPLDDALFERVYGSREPFWTTLDVGGVAYRVYFSNDRAGIYALGFPAPTAFDHCLNLAELVALAGLAYLLLLVGGAALTWPGWRGSRPAAALWYEIRSSFYRKLLLAFAAAAVVPVLVLALVIRSYFATLLRAEVEGEAARTAAVARRVVEEALALQQRGAVSLNAVSDDTMVWISRVIDQDVNLFSGPRLVATSERDLFASGLLPVRTPPEVYQAVALERLPRFVGEDRIGSVEYMLAATPVQLGGRDAILTVPLTAWQNAIEREIDELDRGVYLAAVLLVLAGAAIGFSMAERIADPVGRLTRATRRIARGDFDASVMVRSADELQRLVEAFNRMAADLKAQREQLERTNRLEAWAEMARQVAHEIKNPLTPIQLSAEHLRRVHRDGGAPLGPVVDACVDSILNQVRLLRRIAAEFSSFASAPVPRRGPAGLLDLVREIIDPYRAGLEGRIQIELDIPPSLPEVDVDRTLVGRALSNIVENALHAMPDRGRLRLVGRDRAGQVALEVSDTGVGMDAEALERIFEPYFSTKAIGTGLGLTIAKRNIEMTGGTIEVRSARGVGTTVVLGLPVVSGEGRPAAQAAASGAVS